MLTFAAPIPPTALYPVENEQLSDDMNVASLNNLWSYLQGLTLTPSNKKWLADHLYEAAGETAVATANGVTDSSVTKMLAEDELPEAVRRLIGVAAPVDDDDVDYRDAYYSHLAKKYA